MGNEPWPDTREFWVRRRVMVTGGNGFLGKYVVRKLKERGAEVLVADIGPSVELRAGPSAELRAGPSVALRVDLRRPEDVRRALSEGRPRW